jgi:hypothetical protein
LNNSENRRNQNAQTEHRKSARRDPAHDERDAMPSGHSACRLLAWQPLSLTLADPKPFDVSLHQIGCRVALRPAEQEELAQRTLGGSFISLDFYLPTTTDLLVGVNKGMELLEDFLSAVALVEGAMLRAVEPIQMARADHPPRKYMFIRFLPLLNNHWDRPISQTTVNHARRLVAHWNGLDTGIRLRRAARHFRQAIGTPDDLTAFQYAYMGLEAMEKPLAQSMNIPPGVEESQGACANCGETYTWRRTVLAGVRAYVHGDVHPATASVQRKKEWKELSGLRQDLFHGLVDASVLESRAQAMLPAGMHYLHDAICCESHAHDLESPGFRLARRAHQLIMIGHFAADDLGPLESWAPLLGTQEMKWVPHDRYRFVPEFCVDNPGIRDLRARFFWLKEPLSRASEADLEAAEWESD